MNVARADDGLWHIAEIPKQGIAIRVGHGNQIITLPHEEAWKFLAGLTGVLGGREGL